MGGGNLPLGGMGKEFGGHKGYGLAIMVDILCAVLCGAAFGPAIADIPSSLSDRVSHFFGAIKIDRFRDPEEFRRDMDKMFLIKHTYTSSGTNPNIALNVFHNGRYIVVN